MTLQSRCAVLFHRYNSHDGHTFLQNMLLQELLLYGNMLHFTVTSTKEMPNTHHRKYCSTPKVPIPTFRSKFYNYLWCLDLITTNILNEKRGAQGNYKSIALENLANKCCVPDVFFLKSRTCSLTSTPQELKTSLSSIRCRSF